MSAPRRYEDIPGPRGVPFFGNAFQFDKGRVHEQFAAWVQEYGPYVRLRIGPRDLLLVADHAVIGSVLRDRPERFRRPTNQARIAREMGFEEGLFFANDAVWKRQRRMVMAALDPGHVKAFFPSLKTVVGRLEGRWRKAAAAGTVIDLQADLMRYTVDAIAGLAFGADVNTLESDDDVIQRHLNQIFPALARRALASFPYWRYLPLPADRRLDRSVREVKAAIARFIAEARAAPARRPGAAQPPAQSARSDDRRRRRAGQRRRRPRQSPATSSSRSIAGEDTTANTLAWLLDFLHRHPEAMRRAQEEVKRGRAPNGVVHARRRWRSCRSSTRASTRRMRLKPVAPLLPSQANQDTVVGDVAVPANTFVVGVMRPDALEDRYFPDADGLRSRALARCDGDAPNARSTSAGVDAVRRRAEALPGALSGAARDEDGDRDAARRLHDRPRRHARRLTGARAVRLRDGAGRPAR